MDQSSHLSLPYPYPIIFSNLIGEEEVIHEARRKRQRIGNSPPYPRSIMPPLDDSSIRLQFNIRGNDKTQRPIHTQPTAGPSRPREIGSDWNLRRDQLRKSLQEAMKELHSCCKKIKKLTLVMDQEYNQGQLKLPLIDRKVEELFDVLSFQFGDARSDRDELRVRTNPKRRSDDMVYPAGNYHDKRKRSRTILSLKRTFETMDIDVDP